MTPLSGGAAGLARLPDTDHCPVRTISFMKSFLARFFLMLGNIVIGLSVLGPAGMLNELADGLLVGTLRVVAVAHGASALAPGYGAVLALRLVMLAIAAIYTPQAAATVALIVPEARRPSAIAFVFLGWLLVVVGGLLFFVFLVSFFGWRAGFIMLGAAAG